MKRLPVFVLLGPALVWVAFFLVAAPLRGFGSVFDEGGGMVLASFLGTFGVMLAPFIGLAWLDQRMGASRWRILATAAAGFAFAVLLIYGLSSGADDPNFRLHWPYIGLVVAIPAGLCSWVGGLYARQRSP